MAGDLVADQISYYRNRATEYDATAYGDVNAARERIARIVTELDPRGHVLEIACGTGMWTEALARVADSVVALDAAPEAIAIARTRVTGNVRFEVADVFAWDCAERFDTVFFSAWLSHVPQGRFDDFWTGLRDRLAPAGRVIFLDEHVDASPKEAYVADGVVERTLGDGRTFRIVKHFIDPDGLRRRLAGLGWDAHVTRDGPDWVHGVVRPQ
jgi:2-polyprenyl-3-methyl-5-hydroxy-6-metoxy-1,4-benzoquinol methylase